MLRLRRRRGTVWSLVLLSFTSCADHDPAAPLGPELQAALYQHATDPQDCLTTEYACLMDNVVSSWVGEPRTPDGYTYEIVDAVTPTVRGAVVTAKYRQTVTATGFVVTEATPPCWIRRSANYPDREVAILGMNLLCNFVYFTFTSYAPLPAARVLEYERPDTVVCQVGQYCSGPFRIIVSLEGSGWYSGDETLIYVEGPNGSRLEQIFGTMAINGSNVEWSFATLSYPGPSSRIAIEYYPWGRNRPDDVSLAYLPLDIVSPSLVLTVSSGTVAPGDTVTFTAEAQSSVLIDVLEWLWIPLDPLSDVRTQPCPPGVNPCVQPVFENGTMQVRARIDGQERTASALVTTDCPGLFGDSLLDNSVMRAGMKEIWDLSNADDIFANRLERAGYLMQDIATGEYSFDTVLNTSINTPCRTGYIPNVANPPSKRFVALVHTHPATHGELLPASCQRGPGATYNARTYNGPSGADLDAARDLYEVTGAQRISSFYVIDKDAIYHVPPGTTRLNASSMVTRKPRQGSAICPIT